MYNFGQIVLPACILVSHLQTVGTALGTGQADFGIGMHGQGYGSWDMEWIRGLNGTNMQQSSAPGCFRAKDKC